MATPGFTAEYGLYRSTAHYSTVGYADGADGTPGFEESGVLISTAMAFAEMSENIEQVTLARFPSGSGPTYPQGGYTGFNQGFPYGFPLGSFGPNSPFNAPYDFGDLPFWPGGVPILGHRSPCDNFNCPAEYICVVTGGKPTCQTCESFCGCN